MTTTSRRSSGALRGLCLAAALLLLLLASCGLRGAHPGELGQGLRAAAANLKTANLGSEAQERVVLVTGATGRTGLQTYQELKKRAGVRVRALVRNATKAAALLDCGPCGSEQGIFVGDVTKPKSLPKAAFQGVDTLIVLTSAKPIKSKSGKWTFPKGGWPKEVDWKGQVVQFEAAVASGVDHVVLVSTAGTTAPEPPYIPMPGHDFFFKLNAEAVLMQSQLRFTIVKPCGLTNAKVPFASQVGHCDELPHPVTMPLISRSKVAEICVEAAIDPARSAHARFDVCNDPLRPGQADDFDKLFAKAKKLDCFRSMWAPVVEQS
ncbi:Uncharacterized protein At5g02240 [Durusdinium trenchii]|uniref:Uncharacterized protein At5g02240 n=1 Tax=Durusdinium trenchii TaxID=1381693 RepID=A0ABP0JU81_9DINO